MTVEEFDQTMRSFVKRQPFMPFVVELLNGNQIVVPFPEVGFGGGWPAFAAMRTASSILPTMKCSLFISWSARRRPKKTLKHFTGAVGFQPSAAF